MEQRAGGSDPSWDRTRPGRLGLGSRSVAWTASGLSVALHLLFIVMYPSLVRRIQPEGATFRFPDASSPTEGIDVIQLIEVGELPELERPEDPDEIEDVDEPAAVVERPSFGGIPVIELARPGLTAAERLRPNLTDRRLWGPVPREFGELTLEQREELVIAGRLTEWYDSVTAEAAADARWTDWTFTDGDGRRWGVADGKVYGFGQSMAVELGGLTIQQREYMWQWDEIARQGAQAAVQQTVRDRIDAIRARRDRERADAQPDTTGSSR